MTKSVSERWQISYKGQLTKTCPKRWSTRLKDAFGHLRSRHSRKLSLDIRKDSPKLRKVPGGAAQGYDNWNGHHEISSNGCLRNGIAAHALELDDGSRHATYHPGSSIIPSSLALCEAEGKTARDLITAIAVGYEVSIRIGKSMNPHHYLKGFHPTGTVAHFGTTAACCQILNLSVEETVNALGLAGSLASASSIRDRRLFGEALTPR